MADKTKTPNPTPNPNPTPTLLEAVTEEALRSSKRVAEVFIVLGSVGMFIAFVYGLTSLGGPDGASPAGFAGFVFALLFTSVAAINRGQAIRVLRRAGREPGPDGGTAAGVGADPYTTDGSDTLPSAPDTAAARRGAAVTAEALRLYRGDEAKALLPACRAPHAGRGDPLAARARLGRRRGPRDGAARPSRGWNRGLNPSIGDEAEASTLTTRTIAG